MSSESNSIKAIFQTALEKETPADRAAYLEDACAGNLALRRRVESLLRLHDQPDPLLDQPAAQHLVGDEENLDFLEPTTKPGALGRLGHYEVLDVVGRGGMGIVLRAFDEKLHRIAAVKVLIPVLAGNGAARQRFVREARAAAAVNHDNVIGILAVEDGGSVPYIVMQFVAGKTLQDKLDDTGPLPLPETLRIGLQIAEGLAAAHRQGIVHRDIKPANILLENGIERVKITDFGLARTTDDASLTRSGFVAGTPAYMSPEQAGGERIDYRSDLFSLGSVLYAMCAGHAPFRAESAMAVLRRVCDEVPRPLREVNPAVPKWLADLVAKLQAKRPTDRFASAAEVGVLLSRRLAQLQSGDDSTLNGVPTEPRATPARTGRWALLRAAALALLLAATAATTWYVAKGRPDGQEVTKGDPSPAAAPSGPVTLKPVQTLLKHAFGVRTLAFSPNGKVLASGGPDDVIYLWDTATWEPRGPLEGHEGDVTGLAFAPGSGKLASVTSGADTCRVRVWDVAAAPLGPATPLGLPSSGSWDVAYSPDGRTLVCGGSDKKLYKVDATTGAEQVLVEEAASQFVRGLSISPDGLRVAAGGSGPTKVWDAATGNEIPTPVKLPPGMCPTFVPGGLAGWNHGEGRVILCDLPSGRLRTDWRPPKGTINGLAVSKDGRHLAGSGEDGLTRVWSATDLTEVATLVGHRGPVYSVAFAPDGTRLATGGEEDRSIHIWDLPEVCHVRK